METHPLITLAPLLWGAAYLVTVILLTRGRRRPATPAGGAARDDELPTAA
jgi:hypothetical protein